MEGRKEGKRRKKREGGKETVALFRGGGLENCHVFETFFLLLIWMSCMGERWFSCIFFAMSNGTKQSDCVFVLFFFLLIFIFIL